MKQRGNSLFSLLLLFLFTFCAFFLLLVQVQGYQKLIATNEKISENHTPLAYLTNKVHAFDEQGKVEIVDKEGNTCLKMESPSSVLWIYEYKGSLYELYSAKEYEINLGEGEKLFSIKDFKVRKEANTLYFAIKVKKQVEEFAITLRSGGSV